jgi:hypothetical protein
MQAIIDHIAAVVIGAAIILMLAALSMRGQDNAIEAVQVHIGKTEIRSFIDLIEQDFNGMGSGMAFPNRMSASRVIEEFGPGTGSDAGYTVFRFRGLVSMTGAPDPVLVTYRWRQQGTATLPNGDVVDLVEVERRTASGESAVYQNVVNFSVALMDQVFADIPPGSLALHEARYVDVEVAMISPVGVETVLEQTRWSKQFRPANLNPESATVLQASCVNPLDC